MMRSIAGTALAFALVLAIVLTGVGIFYIFQLMGQPPTGGRDRWATTSRARGGATYGGRGCGAGVHDEPDAGQVRAIGQLTSSLLLTIR